MKKQKSSKILTVLLCIGMLFGVGMGFGRGSTSYDLPTTTKVVKSDLIQKETANPQGLLFVQQAELCANQYLYCLDIPPNVVVLTIKESDYCLVYNAKVCQP